MTKHEKIIDKLCRELGYPGRLLNYQEYYNVLVKAQAIVYGK